MVVGDVSSSVEEADAADVDAASAVDRIDVDDIARRGVITFRKNEDTCGALPKPHTPRAVRDAIIVNMNNDTLRG
jgi:hypothetical protein